MRIDLARRALPGVLGALLVAPPPQPALAAAPAGAKAVAEYQVSKAIQTYGPKLGGPFHKVGGEEALGLEIASRYAEGELQADGARVIEVMQGAGPVPTEGSTVYFHFKLWVGGFDRGMPADASYFDTRPLKFTWGGEPRGRLLPGLVSGIRGMREGGWRRLVLPPSLGYGNAGLATQSGLANRKGIAPGATLYVDVRMMDAGSGKCDAIIGESDRLKSINCIRGLA